MTIASSFTMSIQSNIEISHCSTMSSQTVSKVTPSLRQLQIRHSSGLGAPSTVSDNKPASKPKSFRQSFNELPTEIRCLVYDFLAMSRVITILQPKEPVPAIPDPLQYKQHLLNTDAINQLYHAEENLQGDILNWVNSRKQLISHPEVGIFNPGTSVFLVDFQWLPICQAFSAQPVWMKKHRISDYLAWDYFTHQDIYQDHVRHLQINLGRYHIFSDDVDCMRSMLLDLRCLKNFKNLEQIDFYCDSVRYFKDEYLCNPFCDAEQPWTFASAELELETLWQFFWFWGPWCHPDRACSCCALPEVRIWFLGLKGWGWQVFDFERERHGIWQATEYNREALGLDPNDTRHNLRSRVKDYAGDLLPDYVL